MAGRLVVRAQNIMQWREPSASAASALPDNLSAMHRPAYVSCAGSQRQGQAVGGEETCDASATDLRHACACGPGQLTSMLIRGSMVKFSQDMNKVLVNNLKGPRCSRGSETSMLNIILIHSIRWSKLEGVLHAQVNCSPTWRMLNVRCTDHHTTTNPCTIPNPLDNIFSLSAHTELCLYHNVSSTSTAFSNQSRRTSQ